MGGLKPSELGHEEGPLIPISKVGKLRLGESQLDCPGYVTMDFESLVILIGCCWSDMM